MADEKAPEHRVPAVAGTEQGYAPAHDPRESVNSPKSDPGRAYLTGKPALERPEPTDLESKLDDAEQDSGRPDGDLPQG